MYVPKLFEESDRRFLHDFIEAHSFGVLIAPGAGAAPEIAHLPFLLDRDAGPYGSLRVHVARSNPIWKAAEEGLPVVAVFSGPNAYVSPRWYEHPTAQVPTWNYAVVHAHGRAEGPMSPPDLRRLLDDLSAFHEEVEAPPGSPPPWSPAVVEPDVLDKLIKSIVGFTISVDKLIGKLKLSQNRSPEDRARVKRALRERAGPDDRAVADLMASRARIARAGPSSS
jgi:transcriptional regulator